MVGSWSEYERQAIESRPCPKCGAYTLNSPEPTRPTGRKVMFNRRVRLQPARAG